MKTALITGASGGIGSAIAKRFADDGYAVALQYHTNERGALRVSSEFPDGTPFVCVQSDLRSAQSVSGMIDVIHRHLGSNSVLVNCAGTALPQMLFSDTTDSDYQRVFDTNVLGMMRVTKAVLPDLRERSGAIVNLSSIWGLGGGSCEVLYASSKAAVIGFTKSLANELAPCGITVNCVAPGLIDTAMNAHLSEDALEAFRKQTPLGRLGTPEDVAEAVLFLAKAGFVTGQVLCCDGGYLN